MSQEEAPNFRRRLEESRTADLASGLLSVPLCPRRRWAKSPNDLDFSDFLALTEKVSAKDCLRDLTMAQPEKFRAGKDLQCSEGLARQICRLVLEEDLEL